MNKLSEKSIEKILLFLNDKSFNSVSMNRNEIKILFNIYSNATSKILELEEKNRQLENLIQHNQLIINGINSYINQELNEISKHQYAVGSKRLKVIKAQLGKYKGDNK